MVYGVEGAICKQQFLDVEIVNFVYVTVLYECKEKSLKLGGTTEIFALS